MGLIPFVEIDYDRVGLIRGGSRGDNQEQEQSYDEQDAFQNNSSFKFNDHLESRGFLPVIRRLRYFFRAKLRLSGWMHSYYNKL